MKNGSNRVATAPFGLKMIPDESYRVCGAYGMPNSFQNPFKNSKNGIFGFWGFGPVPPHMMMMTFSWQLPMCHLWIHWLHLPWAERPLGRLARKAL